MPLLDFAHGTELKMYVHEQRGDDPDGVPAPVPAVHAAGEDLRPRPGARRRRRRVDLVGADRGVLVGVPGVPARADRALAQRLQPAASSTPPRSSTPTASRCSPGSRPSRPPGGEGAEPVAPEGGFDAVVAFVGKFADWKRLDALLRAAASYEHGERRILTLVAGSGPVEQQVQMHDLAAELGLERTYFLGPRQQEELATIFACADVGVFPSWREPFGLVFLECMACGTPVIGADSGGPRDFVTDEVGTLVPETDDRQELADSLAAAVEPGARRGLEAGQGPRGGPLRPRAVQRRQPGVGPARRGRPAHRRRPADPWGDPVDQARGRDHRREPRDAGMRASVRRSRTSRASTSATSTRSR